MGRTGLLLPLAAALALSAAEPQPPGMVLVPGGEFQRGRTFDWPDTKLAWYPVWFQDDVPVRKLTLSPFYLDEAEVTNERYAVFVKARRHRAPYHWKRGAQPESKGALPVVNVDWHDAAAFCAAEGKRLPTEAEWERAARGPVDGRMYPWGDEDPKPEQARFGSTDGPRAVCTGRERHGFGLCDMTGNVWEWTADWYERHYYEAAPERDPPGPGAGMYRVVRGGSWFDEPKLFLSVSYRSWARPLERSQTIGFRCAKSAQPPASRR